MKLLLVCCALFVCISALPSETLDGNPAGRKLKLTVAASSAGVATLPSGRNSSTTVGASTRTPSNEIVAVGTINAGGLTSFPRLNRTPTLAGPIASTNATHFGEEDCNIPKRQAARWSGVLGINYNVANDNACCETCRDTPHSRCRSWWRSRSNRRCYLSANR